MMFIAMENESVAVPHLFDFGVITKCVNNNGSALYIVKTDYHGEVTLTENQIKPLRRN